MTNATQSANDYARPLYQGPGWYRIKLHGPWLAHTAIAWVQPSRMHDEGKWLAVYPTKTDADAGMVPSLCIAFASFPEHQPEFIKAETQVTAVDSAEKCRILRESVGSVITVQT